MAAVSIASNAGKPSADIVVPVGDKVPPKAHIKKPAAGAGDKLPPADKAAKPPLPLADKAGAVPAGGKPPPPPASERPKRKLTELKVWSPNGPNSVAKWAKLTTRKPELLGESEEPIKLSELNGVSSEEDAEDIEQEHKQDDCKGKKYKWEELDEVSLVQLVDTTLDPVNFADVDQDTLDEYKSKFLLWIEVMKTLAASPGKWQLTVGVRNKIRKVLTAHPEDLGDHQDLDDLVLTLQVAKGTAVSKAKTDLTRYYERVLQVTNEKAARAKIQKEIDKKSRDNDKKKEQKMKEKAIIKLDKIAGLTIPQLSVLFDLYRHVHGNPTLTARSQKQKWESTLKLTTTLEDEYSQALLDGVHAESCEKAEIKCKKLFQEIKIDLGKAYDGTLVLPKYGTVQFIPMPPKPAKPGSGGPKKDEEEEEEKPFEFDGQEYTRETANDWNDTIFDAVVEQKCPNVSFFHSYASIWDTCNTKDYILNGGRLRPPTPKPNSEPPTKQKDSEKKMMDQYLQVKLKEAADRQEAQEKKKKEAQECPYAQAASVSDRQFNLYEWMKKIGIKDQLLDLLADYLAQQGFDDKSSVREMSTTFVDSIQVGPEGNVRPIPEGFKAKLKAGLRALNAA